MLTPLWSLSRPMRRTIPVQADPVSFEVNGAHFLYEPNDMRLYAGTAEAVRDGVAQAESVMTGKPQFALPVVTPGMVVLTMTHACTLRCRYCFAHPEDAGGEAQEETVAEKPGAIMTRETARQTIGLIPPGKDFTVGFFGGEPLIAFDRITEIVEDAEALAAARGVQARFSITTNATLLTDTVAAFLQEHDFGVIASLDGPPELHNANRPTASGGASYDTVMAGLLQIAKHPALARRTTLRATFDGADASAHLVERLAHLNDVARRLGFGNVSVEPADLSEGCGGFGAAKPVRPDAALQKEYMDAARWFVEEKRAGRSPKFHHLTVRMHRLRTRTPAPSECGAGVGYVAADVDGTLHACHRLGASKIGSAASGIDTEAQTPWRDNRYYTRAKCPDCWLRNVCGGGCRVNSAHNCGDIRTPDPLGCWLAETCVKAAAWVLAECNHI